MWHFTETSKLLRYGDGREVVAGKTLKVKSPVVLCNKGLHACEKILDAAYYAPGPYVWFVELGKDAIHDADKSVSTSRKAVWGYDATEVLREFSRRVALDSVRKYWNSKKFGEFPEVTMKYLQTGEESLRSAARSAAESAAWSAAESAAESAARSAARSEYNTWLEEMILAGRPKKTRKK